MRKGMTPSEAAADAISRIIPYYPTFAGALVATTIQGDYGKTKKYLNAISFC